MDKISNFQVFNRRLRMFESIKLLFNEGNNSLVVKIMKR